MKKPLKTKNSTLKTILVTGGAGYIGSHTVLLLIEAGYSVVVLDNFSNSSAESLKRVEQITGKSIELVEGDIRSREDLSKVFESHDIDSVIHFAGLKAVGESVQKPLEYYDNNVYGTIVLLETMTKYGCKSIVFSSSATVYGDPDSVPIKEDFPVGGTTNPYATSKYMIERILKDLYISDNDWQIVILRYFNPVGAHESGLIGEDPNGIPNNLMPYITQTAVGKLACLSVFGDDYDTPDGTGVRDYIHVMDLSDAHVKAIEYLTKQRTENGKRKTETNQPLIVNLGTGTGYSVLEMIKAFEKASGKEVPYCIAPRRPGDIASCYADPSYAKETLGWQATRDIEQICRDAWRWQEKNPEGF